MEKSKNTNIKEKQNKEKVIDTSKEQFSIGALMVKKLIEAYEKR